MTRPAPVPLARLPTPLEPSPRFGASLGLDLLWKRDDLTGLELTGNKARKLEWLVADAEARRADVLVTCGGIQSNHCRATAFAAARRGLAAVVLLRTEDPGRPPSPAANHLLDLAAGAEVRFVSPAEYARRGEVLAEVADELRARGRRPYVIPEGGSNALGSLGYVAMAEELAAQLPVGWRGGPFTIAVACGSGGTAAGLELGARRALPDARVASFAVCNDAAYFRRVIAGICAEARARFDDLAALAPVAQHELDVDASAIGPGYARATAEGLDLIGRVARADGVLLDPVYTGKAMLGLAARARAGVLPSRRVVFVHTGGSFGVFPFAEALAGAVCDRRAHAWRPG
jgi:D-cysteine desulfhydrase